MRAGRVLLAVVVLVGALTGAAPAHGGVPGALRVLTWNVYLGGHGVGPDNLDDLLDQVVELRPDVFFSVETYGSGPRIAEALTRRAGKGGYTGVQVTDHPAGRDNLWIFTRFRVTEVFDAAAGLSGDFHFGGARVQPRRGPALNLFALWLPYTNPWNGYLVDENAAGVRAGLPPRHSAADVAHAERAQTDHITDIVDRRLPAMLAGNTDPVLIGGDLNTLPADDWTPRWAGCPHHFGMSYPLRATRVLTDAGFVDTYRAANPDACTHPGATWSPLPTERLITEQRIDLTFARGPLEVRRAFVVAERMRRHGPGTFYSDHAAVVTDLALPR
ncbi:Endonuclease/Exonuclease/phosphatase family protein [Amycolatopsis arida]|uniref:Endonuclease/Exonuclease/phosphatase family protein n=1 Tax=Amycolatopsis arida TaxID=587909 RepID=A0A1I5SAN2_9PSEU|nr:endonuclease/exonuclease/phosphatase family protein [Amycolatopsis arida]TDX96542.1 endonuclease/exonuclease/phosphatase family protein [Amycolatopsis arida]SFP67769.1 Endonuclease/Exonuclease/phosphatase family protein [Amycolatopsis arida]